MKIAIQGTRGSFHEQAAHVLYPESQIIDCEDFSSVFEAVCNGKANKGIVAIENNIYGSINIVYSLLSRYNLFVIREITLLIDQYLIGSLDRTVQEYNNPDTLVISQAPAIAQCERWLAMHLPLAKKQESSDTAKSVESIIDTNNLAIGSKRAAEIYGATIVSGPINDTQNNKTRFIVISKYDNYSPGANRTSLILTTDHKPGALVRALEVFDDARVNLSKLDSHPIEGDLRHYSFYIDCDIGAGSPKFKEIMEKLSGQECIIKILGSYYHEESTL